MVSRQRMAGLSLIELMIAMVMALIVAAGIISVFTSTSSSNKVQQQMAALQEEGRFAIHSLRSDLANANGTYCSNTGGNAGQTASGLYLDALRSPTIYANVLSMVNAAFYDNTTPITGDNPTGAYSLPSFLFMRGYSCAVGAACLPVDPSTGTEPGGGAGIPEAGTTPGARVVGTDVLTLRYLKPGSGWAIVPTGSAAGSTIEANPEGQVTSIKLNPLPGEQPASDFTGNLAMLADCSSAQVFAVTDAGGTLAPTGANYANPVDITQGAAPRVFAFDASAASPQDADFQTVTYWVKVVCASGDNPCTGPTTGELERRVDGKDQPLVRGIERLNFQYGVINAQGNTEFLTADQVDNDADASGNSIPCPPDVSTPGGMPQSGPGTSCLWRAIQTIQVSILMDGQTPLYTLTPAELAYIYSPDGDNVPTAPADHAVQPKADQGFPNHLLRREFTTVVALRNFNP